MADEYEDKLIDQLPEATAVGDSDLFVMQQNSEAKKILASRFKGVTFTPSMDASGNLSWTNDGGRTNPQTVNLTGPQGTTGETGNGISSISKTSTSGLVDTYTISFTDGTSSTFTVQNGKGIASVTLNSDYTLTIAFTDGTSSKTASIRGETGAAAGFGTVTATVTENGGEPGVTVTASGGNTAKNFAFAFENLKGDKGEGYDDLNPPQTVSGSPATFVTTSSAPINPLIVDVEPVQDLHGYDKPWPGGGGKNLLPVTLTNDTKSGVSVSVSNGVIMLSGTSTGIYHFPVGSVLLSPGTYVGSGCPSGGSASTYSLRFGSMANNKSETGAGFTFILTESAEFPVYLTIADSDINVNGLAFRPMIRLASETDDTFEPYENICPISGWDAAKVTRTGKNLWGGSKMLEDLQKSHDSRTTVDGTNITYYASYTTKDLRDAVRFKENTQYTFIIKYYNKRTDSNYTLRHANLGFVYTDGTDGIENGFKYRTESEEPITIVVTSEAGKTIDYIRNYDTAGRTTMYTAESGVFEGVLTADDFEPYDGVTISTPFPSTVYGGYVDVTRGKLVVTHGSVDLGAQTWRYFNQYNLFYTALPSPSVRMTRDLLLSALPYKVVGGYYPDLSDKVCGIIVDKNNEFGFKDSSIKSLEELDKTKLGQLIYLLATPLTYDLTPQQLSSLAGTNVVWADCGPVHVTYRAGAPYVLMSDDVDVPGGVASTKAAAYHLGFYLDDDGDLCYD